MAEILTKSNVRLLSQKLSTVKEPEISSIQNFLLELTVCSAQKSKVVSRCKRRNESGVDDEKVFDLISVDYCFILVSSFLSKHRLTFQPQIIPSITGSADDGAEIQHR